VKIRKAMLGAVLLFTVPSALAAPKDKNDAQANTAQTAPLDASKIENAQPDSNAATPSPELLVRMEVLLDRANFSPGEIDGKDGSNVKRALATYKQAQGLANPQEFDNAALQALTANSKKPVLQQYAITQDDEKGPFIGTVPKDFKALAELKHIGYANPQEELAEKFHMSPDLLRELNPDADFSQAGTALMVVQPRNGELPQVTRIEVDKSANQLRVYDSADKVVAAFPATVGSTERPAPSGKATVVSVAHDPTYTYDPKRVTFGPKSAGVLKIAPGPNNPVGTTWIALSIETYGIHGTPDPDLVGKTASHGCIRLTNWDAAALGKAVKKGTPVDFVGSAKPKPT
jgi:lipoprotein-anchoring transpeptidase ErfK/SrfK